jgi:hypothetical protein
METQTPGLESLVRRVEKLEKDARLTADRLRSYRLTLVVAFLLVVVYVVVPQAMELWHPRTLTAGGLTLQDQDGKTRASMVVLDDWGPHIDLLDQKKETRIDMGLSEGGGPRLALNDVEGRPRVILEVSDDGNGRLSIYNAEGELVAAVPGSGDLLGVADDTGDVELGDEE